MRYRATLLLAGLAGCADPLALDHAGQPVLGGDPVGSTDLAYLAVNRAIVKPMGNPFGSFSWGNGSGIVIAPRLVLTVAHNGNQPGDYMDARKVAAGTAAPFEYVDVLREHDWPFPLDVDLGLWVLEAPLTTALPYWNHAQLDYGPAVDFYGYSTGDLTRTTDCEVWLIEDHPTMGARYTANCFGATGDGGDSGGPIFDESMQLVGLHANSWEPPDLPPIWNSMGPRLAPEYVEWIDGYVDDYRAVLRTADADADTRADLVLWNDKGRESWLDRAEVWPDGGAEAVFELCDHGTLLVGDFDAAAGEDLLCHRDSLVLELTSAAGGIYGAPTPRKGFCPDGTLSAGDFDGDGLDDLLCRQAGAGTTMLHAPLPAAPPAGALARPDWSERGSWCADGLVLVGRFEPLDQRDDALCVTATAMSLRRGDAAGLGPATSWASAGFCDTPGDQLMAGDVDGAGVDDLVCWNGAIGRLKIDLAAGSGPVFTGPEQVLNDYDFCDRQGLIADVTGNGKVDFLCHDDRTGQTRIDAATYSPPYFDGVDNARAPDLDTGLWPL